ncbi:hypothetical protein RB614_24695 [Phytohabitans sp. ZYX-F-186]|uniref:Ferric siderophore reductase C-terminal domain-containing protein n=1 Tax=Phytohabitans maris TaxID=3071409 RepID=A0ABU0ZL06_9ACTN|nr:hypothetical protein [Phytohabitans sp. ZYX-F-186]MDQ7907725.1 hypothetical protein [Phytohabitans sp. ZYX-F-186]
MPLANALLERYNAADGYPPAGAVRDGAGWHTLRELHADGSVLAAQMRAFAASSGCPAQTAATHMAGWVTGSFIRPLVYAYREERRLPLFTMDGTALRADPGGWFNALAVEAPVLAVLPGDPLAGKPGVVVTSTMDADLIGTVLALSGPVLDTLRGVSRLGRRTAWALVADTVMSAFAGELPPGPAHAAVAEADRLLAAGGPLAVRRRWSGPVPLAAACCLAYKRPGLEHCERVCPKLDDVTRRDQITTWLRQPT